MDKKSKKNKTLLTKHFWIAILIFLVAIGVTKTAISFLKDVIHKDVNLKTLDSNHK